MTFPPVPGGALFLRSRDNLTDLADGAVAYQNLAGAHDKLTSWYSVLATRGFASVNVTVLGDSTCYQNASVWGRDWPSALVTTLNTHYPAAGLTTHGRGWLPLIVPGQPFASDISSLNYLTLTNTPGQVTGLGINLRAWDLSADGGVTAVYTLTGTNAYLFYATQPGGGTFTYKLGSGATTPVSTDSGTLTDGVITVVGLSGSEQTLTIAYDSGGPVWFEGLIETNGDDAKGILTTNGGCSGTTSGDWAAMFSDPDISNPGGAIVQVEPSVVILSMGSNDYNNSIAPADFQANLTAVIAGVRTAVTNAALTPLPSFLLLAPPNPGPGWEAYQAVYYAVAAADPSGQVDVLDLAAGRFPAWLAAAAYNLYLDGEFSDNGHGFVADIVASFLGPA
jgi:lysophospholipase L1-like esterase